MTARASRLDPVFVLRFMWEETASERLDPTKWRVCVSDINADEEFYAEGLEAACGVVRSLLLGYEV